MAHRAFDCFAFDALPLGARLPPLARATEDPIQLCLDPDMVFPTEHSMPWQYYAALEPSGPTLHDAYSVFGSAVTPEFVDAMVRDVPEFGSSVFRFLEENLMRCLLRTPAGGKASLKAVSSSESFNDMSECPSTCGSHCESAEEDASASDLETESDARSAIWSEPSADFCAFPTLYEGPEEEQLGQAVDELPIEVFLTDRNVRNTLRMLPDLFNDGL